MIAAASADVALAFVEIGAVTVVLAALARLASRLGITAVPLYLLAGLAVGEGGIAPLDVSEAFIAQVADIGVLLLLLALGLEYSSEELRQGLRTGIRAGAVDAMANFAPGFLVGILLGWQPAAAVLLGGVTWVSSSGIVAKVLADLDRLANRETPAVLNVLVIEDLAMAVFLPVAAALVAGGTLAATVATVAGAVAVAGVILLAAFRLGGRLSEVLGGGSDESVLLAVFGLTLLVAGVAQRLNVSAGIGAFLVGLALSGPVQHRATTLIGPLRDLFAAVFFVFFSFQVDPSDLVGVLAPAAVLAIVAMGTKVASGWVAAAGAGVARAGRIRAGATLMARGEFSIVIASLGATLVDGAHLEAMAATFVLITAVVGPVATRVLGSRPPSTRRPLLAGSGPEQGRDLDTPTPLPRG